MHFSTLLITALPLAAKAINVLQSNDDGWAEKNIRVFYSSLNEAGFSSIISAPAQNESGRGSLDAPPETVGDDGCEFSSCPPGSPPTGNNASMVRFNYVNSYPVTSMKYGIQTLSPKFFGGRPDIAVAGPNVGSNLGLVAQFSGTVGAAVEAVKEGIPGIAFSGTTGSQTAWNAPLETYMTVYADLATTVTQAVSSGSKPYLPSNVWLNVNFPAVNSNCSAPSNFKYILTRINTAIPYITPKDVQTCNNNGYLPTESHVVDDTDGCFVAISVGDASDKTTAGASQQKVVLDRIQSILSCLPS